MTSAPSIDGVKARWRTHVQMLGNFNADVVGRTFDRLCASYAEPHRHYHTLVHLTSLFDCLEKHGEEIGDAARLAFAAWYHDVVYDPRRSDNEAKSAERAMKELDDLGAESALRSHVVQLILATKNHAGGGRDYDDDIFLDADLAILGAPEGEYRTYVRNVRAEYAHLDDPAFEQLPINSSADKIAIIGFIICVYTSKVVNIPQKAKNCFTLLKSVDVLTDVYY